MDDKPVAPPPTHNITKSARAGLRMPVARVEARLRKSYEQDHGRKLRVSPATAVLLTAVAELVVASLLKQTGNTMCNTTKRTRVTVADLQRELFADEELKYAFVPADVPEVRVVSMPKKTSKRNKKRVRVAKGRRPAALSAL
jgi:histone H3/H4